MMSDGCCLCASGYVKLSKSISILAPHHDSHFFPEGVIQQGQCWVGYVTRVRSKSQEGLRRYHLESDSFLCHFSHECLTHRDPPCHSTGDVAWRSENRVAPESGPLQGSINDSVHSFSLLSLYTFGGSMWNICFLSLKK